MEIERFSDFEIRADERTYLLCEFPYDLLDVTFYSRHRIVSMPVNYIGICDMIDVTIRDDVNMPLLHKEKNVTFYIDDYKKLYRVIPNAIGKLPPVSGKITGVFYGFKDIDQLNDIDLEFLIHTVKSY